MMLIGQTPIHSLHCVHLSLFNVIAPPNTSKAFSLHVNMHGASDGWQCIQNNVGVSTFGGC